MTRRGFLGFLSCIPAVAKESGKKKFIVTTPGTVLSWDQPVFVYADDRLGAGLELGLTVWSEEEWNKADRAVKFGSVTDGNGKRLFKEPVDYWYTVNILKLSGQVK